MILIITSVSVSLVVATLAFYVYCLATRNGKKKGNDCTNVYFHK